MGGTDNPDNLVRVNVAMHAFLHKCLYEEYGLLEDKLAWMGLSGQKPYREVDEEIENIRRQKISKANKGKIVSEETRKKISNNAIERYKTIEGKNHILKICRNGLGKKRSVETKNKISSALSGRTFTAKSKSIMSDKAKSRMRKTCQVCDKTMDVSNFNRHNHGINCKRKKK